jgi:hypothetical protein
VLVLLEKDVSVLLDDEKLPILLDGENIAVLLSDEVLVPVVLTDDELGSEAEELAVLEVLALLMDELIVTVLLDSVLGNELLPLLLVLEELSDVLENVLHGGPVVNVLVNVAVTNDVTVYVVFSLTQSSIQDSLPTVLTNVIEVAERPKSDLHKHALL